MQWAWAYSLVCEVALTLNNLLAPSDEKGAPLGMETQLSSLSNYSLAK